MEILWQIQILQPKPTVATAGTAAVITDDFDPILKNLTVSFNGTAWTEGVDTPTMRQPEVLRPSPET